MSNSNSTTCRTYPHSAHFSHHHHHQYHRDPRHLYPHLVYSYSPSSTWSNLNLAVKVFLKKCVRSCHSSAWNPSAALHLTQSISPTPNSSWQMLWVGPYLLSGLLSYYCHPLLTLSFLPQGICVESLFLWPHGFITPTFRSLLKYHLPSKPTLTIPLQITPLPATLLIILLYFIFLHSPYYIFIGFCFVLFGGGSFLFICLLPLTRVRAKTGRDFCSHLCLQHYYTCHIVGTSQISIRWMTLSDRFPCTKYSCKCFQGIICFNPHKPVSRCYYNPHSQMKKTKPWKVKRLPTSHGK